MACPPQGDDGGQSGSLHQLIEVKTNLEANGLSYAPDGVQLMLGNRVSARMTPVTVSEVSLDSAGHLFVKPKAPEDFTFIWRDASGVRWNAASRALMHMG